MRPRSVVVLQLLLLFSSWFLISTNNDYPKNKMKQLASFFSHAI